MKIMLWSTLIGGCILGALSLIPHSEQRETAKSAQAQGPRERLETAKKELKRNAAVWHYQAALAYLELDEAESAQQEINQAIEADPSNPVSYYAAALIARERKDIKSRRDALVKALELDPDNPEGHFQLADILQGEGKTNEAIREFELCVEKSKAVDAKGYYYDKRGNAYGATGFKKDALKQIKELRRKLESAK
jgi:Tfp pilus assembly protein PilF